MLNQWLRGAVGAALCTGAMLAQAGTVNLTGWAFGNSNPVHVSLPTYNGVGGSFKGSVSGFGAPFDSVSFETYCVELTQSFHLPSGNMSGYSIIAGADNTNALTSVASTGWGSNAGATSARLGQLMTYVAASHAVTTAAQSTSLQLAIWNIVYDTDNTLGGGKFYLTSGADEYADSLLSNSSNTASKLNVFVLKSASSQDFLVTTAVPEPSTYALLFAGFAGLGLVRRRRNAKP